MTTTAIHYEDPTIAEALADARQLRHGEISSVFQVTDEHVASLNSSCAFTLGLWTFEGITEVFLDVIDLESYYPDGCASHSFTSFDPVKARHLANLLNRYADLADARDEAETVFTQGD